MHAPSSIPFSVLMRKANRLRVLSKQSIQISREIRRAQEIRTGQSLQEQELPQVQLEPHLHEPLELQPQSEPGILNKYLFEIVRRMSCRLFEKVECIVRVFAVFDDEKQSRERSSRPSYTVARLVRRAQSPSGALRTSPATLTFGVAAAVCMAL
jgi:hypothetical protein